MAETDSVIVVHTINEARAALKQGGSVTLQSAPDAVFYAGNLYLLHMFRQAAAEFPGTKATFILDCGDAGAEAITAMQMGHTHIRSTAPAPLLAKLRDIANQLGVTIISA